MIIFVYIYYFIGIIPFIEDYNSLRDPRKTLDQLDALKNDSNNIDNELKSRGLNQLIYAIWTFMGLFTQVWYLFGIIIVLAMIPKNKIWIIRLDAILSIILIISIITIRFNYYE